MVSAASAASAFTHEPVFAVAVSPPGTSGAVALYTTKFAQDVGTLPAKDPQSPNKGYLDYVPNPLMTQGKREMVTIAVAIKDEDLERIRAKTFASARSASGAQGEEAVKTELINVSSSMTARLTGTPNLQIKDLSTPEQLITTESPTVWHWEVVPLESGAAELYLVLSTHNRSTDGYPGAKDLEPIQKPITVKIDPFYTVQRFFTNNLAVLVGLSSLVMALAKIPWVKIPLGVGLVLAFSKRRILRTGGVILAFLKASGRSIRSKLGRRHPT